MRIASVSGTVLVLATGTAAAPMTVVLSSAGAGLASILVGVFGLVIIVLIVQARGHKRMLRREDAQLAEAHRRGDVQRVKQILDAKAERMERAKRAAWISWNRPGR
jgi:L-lactate permease